MKLPEKTASTLYETNYYRCLVYHEKQTDDIYLTFCGVERCLPGYEFNCENRTGYHLHVILGGRGVLNVNGTSYALHRGQMFVTKPGEQTWYRADEHDPWVYCWMTFDGHKAAKYIESTGLKPGVNWRDCYEDPKRFYAIVKDVLDRPEMTLANDLQRLSQLLAFISLSIETEGRKQPFSRHENDINTDTYVDKAVIYIQSNFAKIKIADVARNIGINRSYLTKIFKNKMGVSPQEFLMDCKLNYACKLLLETDAQIQDVARRVGYDNLLTFSKIFKGKYGVSPKNYRIRNRSGEEQYL
ncbi:MAG: AraC family transcriptional regulator [Anaerolineaceae bacterium]|nr:AraC family transcriptional regulator [Anaerolineaceae bacterium]